MLRALAWKEWRQQRPLVLTALGLAVLLPLFFIAGMTASSSVYRFEDMIALAIPVLVGFVWPVFAAAMAGSTFAADGADGSLRFLLSRPVSRTRVWLIKVAMATVAWGLVVVGSAVVLATYAWLGVDGGISVARGLFPGDSGQWISVIAPVALLFGSCVYCSTFLKRPMVAALAGLAAAAVLIGIPALVWWLFTRGSPSYFDQIAVSSGVAVGMPVAAVAVFVAAFRVFRRGDLAAVTAREVVRPLALICLLVTLAGAGPAYYGGMRWMARVAADMRGSLAFHDGAVIVAELTPRGLSTRITRVPVGDEEELHPTVENATMPVSSADGEWIVYLRHGIDRARSETIAVRAARRDGSDDRPLLELAGRFWPPGAVRVLIAPDNELVAVTDRSSAQVASLSGSEVARLGLRAQPEAGAQVRSAAVIGWGGVGGRELLWFRSFRRTSRDLEAAAGDATGRPPTRYQTELLAFDVGTGESRILREFAGRDAFFRWADVYGRHHDRPMGWVPAWVREGDGVTRLLVVDTTSGDTVELTDSACRFWGLSADGSRLWYGSCTGELRFGSAHVEMRTYDPATGADEPFAAFEDHVVAGGSSGIQVLPSPNGERVIMHALRRYGAEGGAFLVTPRGSVEHLADHAVPVAWIDDDRVLLRQEAFRRPFELSVVDLADGTARRMYPR